MSWGGLGIGLIILFLIWAGAAVVALFSFTIFILARNKNRDATDPYRASRDKVNLDLQRSKAGMEEYERQVVLDMLRDQLKYSQEDYSELQGEMKALRVQVAKLENGQGQMSNRLDAYRILLSGIQEHVSKIWEKLK